MTMFGLNFSPQKSNGSMCWRGCRRRRNFFVFVGIEFVLHKFLLLLCDAYLIARQWCKSYTFTRVSIFVLTAIIITNLSKWKMQIRGTSKIHWRFGTQNNLETFTKKKNKYPRRHEAAAANASRSHAAICALSKFVRAWSILMVNWIFVFE